MSDKCLLCQRDRPTEDNAFCSECNNREIIFKTEGQIITELHKEIGELQKQLDFYTKQKCEDCGECTCCKKCKQCEMKPQLSDAIAHRDAANEMLDKERDAKNKALAENRVLKKKLEKAKEFIADLCEEGFCGYDGCTLVDQGYSAEGKEEIEEIDAIGKDGEDGK
jgi:hypothetical protein